MPNKNIWKNGLVVGIIVLFIGINIIPGINSKICSPNIDEKTLDTPLTITDQDTASITLHAFGGTWKKENNVVLSSDDAYTIYNMFEELIYEMIHNSCSDKTYILKNEFVRLLDENGLLPEGVSKDEFLSLLNPSWLKSIQNNRFYSLFNKLKQTLKTPLFNRIIQILENIFFNFDPSSKSLGVTATATVCTIASYGEGLTLPLFIPPRPRIVISWYATLAETYVGEIFTNKGFYATEGQTGTAWGFTGGGLTFALPWGNMYAFFGYAAYTKVKADYMEFYPPNQPPVISNENPPSGTENIPLSLSELSFWISDSDEDLMDYTVTTEPYIGSGSGNNKDNGVYIVPISGLEYDKMYTWNVKLTDGNFIVEKDFSFFTVTRPPFNPFEEGWQYRKKITVDHNMVDGNLESFPVLISRVDSDLRDKAQSDGDDILFMDDIGVANRLFYEIEYFDDSSGELVTWVNIPSLSSGVDTVLYMYYGNPVCSSQEFPERVWDSNYIHVWHMGDNLMDSAGFDDGTNHGTSIVSGKIGKGRDFEQYESDYIDLGDMVQPGDGSLTTMTWEAWIKPETQDVNLMCKYNSQGTDYASYWIGFVYDGKFRTTAHSSHTVKTESVTVNSYSVIGEWVYLTATYNLGGIRDIVPFIDGNEVADTQPNNNAAYMVNIPVSDDIGRYRPESGTRYTDGVFDEVRWSKIVRSNAWIKTSYNTMNDSASFFSVGPEESAP